jgi:hypothetical protein
MPRTKLSAHADAQSDFVNLIKKEGYALYGCASNAAPYVGISQQTMSRRLKDVDSFNIRELRGLRTALKIPKEDMLKKLEALL